MRAECGAASGWGPGAERGLGRETGGCAYSLCASRFPDSVIYPRCCRMQTEDTGELSTVTFL